jgi:hypothetical protein
MHDRSGGARLAWVLALACCGPSGPSAVEREVAGELTRVLGLELESVACAAPADGGVACTARPRGHEPFQVMVVSDGERRLRPEGHRKFEYELALGLAERVRARPESVACPPDGDLAQGFACDVVMPGDIATQVHVSADEPERFAWTAPELLMPAAIEERIAGALRDQGREAQVECGSEVRLSVPGASFPCVITFAGGVVGSATVTVMDRAGHVAYRIMDEAAPAGAR